MGLFLLILPFPLSLKFALSSIFIHTKWHVFHCVRGTLLNRLQIKQCGSLAGGIRLQTQLLSKEHNYRPLWEADTVAAAQKWTSSRASFHTVRIRMVWPHFTTYCRGFHPKPPQLLFSVLPLLVRSFRGREFRIPPWQSHHLVRHLLTFRSAQESWVFLSFSFGILENLNFIVVLMATHSSILVWRISWTEEPCGLQSMGSQESDTTEWLSLLVT